jgi:hypothetical protein
MSKKQEWSDRRKAKEAAFRKEAQRIYERQSARKGRARKKQRALMMQATMKKRRDWRL